MLGGYVIEGINKATDLRSQLRQIQIRQTRKATPRWLIVSPIGTSFGSPARTRTTDDDAPTGSKAEVKDQIANVCFWPKADIQIQEF